MPIVLGLVVMILIITLLYSLYQGFAANEPGSKTGTAIWILAPLLAAWTIGANFGEEYGKAATPVTVILMLAFCCYRPQNSELKSKMLSGLKVPASLVAAICLTVPALRLVYAVLSGELKNEGLGSLPIDWMLSMAYPGLIALGVVIFVAQVRRFGIVQFEKEERRYFQERYDYDCQAHEEQNNASSHHGDETDNRYRRRSESRLDEEAPWPDVLGVPRTASMLEIKLAANQLRKTYHPDKMAEMPRFREEAERQVKIINRALEEALAELKAQSAI